MGLYNGAIKLKAYFGSFKAKNMYLGATKLWSGIREIVYRSYDRTISMSYMGAAKANDDYCVLVGGIGTNRAYAFNTSLVSSRLADINDLNLTMWFSQGSGKVGDYLVFAGGNANNNPQSGTNLVVAYNKTLVKSSPTGTGTGYGTQNSGGSMEGYFLNAGYGVIDVYNPFLVKTAIASLFGYTMHPSVAYSNDACIVTGAYGANGAAQSITKNLVKTLLANLSSAKWSCGCANAGGNYLIGPGNTQSNVVDVYNKDFVKTANVLLGVSDATVNGANIDEKGVFYCGLYNTALYQFDENLVRTTLTNPNRGGSGAALCQFNDKMVISTKYDGSAEGYTTVDFYNLV